MLRIYYVIQLTFLSSVFSAWIHVYVSIPALYLCYPLLHTSVILHLTFNVISVEIRLTLDFALSAAGADR